MKKTKDDYAVIRISKEVHELLLHEKEVSGVPIVKIVEKLVVKNLITERREK